jgi:Tfp pilus assembly protein PilN
MRIEINLLGGQKRKAGGGGVSIDFGALLGGLGGGVKDPLLMVVGIVWGLALVFVVFIFLTTTGTIANIEQQVEAAREDSATYADLLEEQQRARDLRAVLLTELQTIQNIDGDRYIWPHIMDELAKALPNYTWIESVRNEGGGSTAQVADSLAPPPEIRFRVAGRASEIEGYTRFIRQLQASPWVSRVVPGGVQPVDADGRSVHSFELVATFQKADSSFILTVPVSESVTR